MFAGTSIGADGEVDGEVCFNTSMTGYQEIITDPSYFGQIVTMTYPHIGNYGTTPADDESRRPACRGVVVRELARRPVVLAAFSLQAMALVAAVVLLDALRLRVRRWRQVLSAPVVVGRPRPRA